MPEAKNTIARPEAKASAVAPFPGIGFVRLAQLVGPGGLLPVSKSTIYAKIRAGEFPSPVKFGRISMWRREDLRRLTDAR